MPNIVVHRAITIALSELKSAVANPAKITDSMIDHWDIYSAIDGHFLMDGPTVNWITSVLMENVKVNQIRQRMGVVELEPDTNPTSFDDYWVSGSYATLHRTMLDELLLANMDVTKSLFRRIPVTPGEALAANGEPAIRTSNRGVVFFPLNPRYERTNKLTLDGSIVRSIKFTGGMPGSTRYPLTQLVEGHVYMMPNGTKFVYCPVTGTDFVGITFPGGTYVHEHSIGKQGVKHVDGSFEYK